jgi:hypothetical protein
LLFLADFLALFTFLAGFASAAAAALLALSTFKKISVISEESHGDSTVLDA